MTTHTTHVINEANYFLASIAGLTDDSASRRPYAPSSVVNDSEEWATHVQSNSDPTYLSWCWHSTRLSQRPLIDTASCGDIKKSASVWVALVKSGPDGWWKDCIDAPHSKVEQWVMQLDDARLGDTRGLIEWFSREYACTTPCSKELQIFWELSLISLRETFHDTCLQSALWPYFLATLEHNAHFPENLPLRIIPDMVKDRSDPIPSQFWKWFDLPLFPQAHTHEKHIKPGAWSVLWHAWLPISWRCELAVRLAETIENAITQGHVFRIPDDLRALWQAGPAFSAPYNIMLASAMLINPRIAEQNPWSMCRTSHWLDDVEHFYPDSHHLRSFYAQLDGLSVEDARAWLAQRMQTSTIKVELPEADLLEDSN